MNETKLRDDSGAEAPAAGRDGRKPWEPPRLDSGRVFERVLLSSGTTCTPSELEMCAPPYCE